MVTYGSVWSNAVLRLYLKESGTCTDRIGMKNIKHRGFEIFRYPRYTKKHRSVVNDWGILCGELRVKVGLETRSQAWDYLMVNFDDLCCYVTKMRNLLASAVVVGRLPDESADVPKPPRKWRNRTRAISDGWLPCLGGKTACDLLVAPGEEICFHHKLSHPRQYILDLREERRSTLPSR